MAELGPRSSFQHRLGGRTADLLNTLNTNHQVSMSVTLNGRWIPTTSVDEYGATLARWFGVGDTSMSTAFPNIGRFAKPKLGFV